MKTILLTILSIFMLAEASVFYTSEKVKRIEKYLLVGILLFICSLTYGQDNRQVIKLPNKVDTIYVDDLSKIQVFKGGVVYVAANDHLNKALYVQKIGDTIRFASNFDDTKDLWVDFLPLPPNYLYNIVNISFHNDTSDYADSDLTGQRTLYKANTTDVIGPYSVNYASPLSPAGSFFVGGVHGHLTYTLTGGGALPTATGGTPTIIGSKYGNLYYSNDSLIVNWSNRILNYTTIQDLGVLNGDSIIQENISLSLFPRQIKVNNTIYVDSADIVTYYGHQWSNNVATYSDSIIYLRGKTKAWEAFANSVSGKSIEAPKYIGWVNEANDLSHRVFGSIDFTKGLGIGTHADWPTYDKSFTSTTKTYHNLIRYTNTSHGNGFENDTLSWLGDYIFTSNDDYFTYKKNGKTNLLAYLVKAKIDTFTVGTVGDMLKINSIDTSLNLVNAYPYKVTARSYGVLDAEIVSKQLPFTADSLIASYDFRLGVINRGDSIITVTDQSGNGNNLTGISNPKLVNILTDSAGISFDGLDDNLNITRATTDDFNVDAGSWSIDFDLKITEKTLGRLIAYYRTSTTPFWTFTQAASGFPVFSIRDNSANAAQNILTTTVSDGEWHHIAIVVDMAKDSITSYVDGIKDNQTTCAAITTVSQTTTTTSFGLNHGLANAYLLRHFNFYKEALRPQDITELYNYYMK